MASRVVGDWKNYHWVEAYEWGCTNIKHVLENSTLGLFHFSDEASQFDVVGYDTIEEAEEALNLYSYNL